MRQAQGVLHYTILNELGAGGMGVVYRAVDTRLDRLVALKFLSSQADPQARQRLMLEARAAARLDHPNIGSIYSIEGLDSEPFIVMALYQGGNLREKLQRGPLGLDEAIDLCVQATRGLDGAHQAGITHRDIKPENLFITSDGTLKILDFGLASMATLDHLTRAGEIVGTPAYLAPEQARGQSIDARADLWALGVVLYEAVTGTLPFVEAGLAGTLLRILRDDPVPASRLRPGVPARLDAVIERALAKDRDERYGSAREMMLDLQLLGSPRVAGGVGVATQAATPTPPATTPAAPATPAAATPPAATPAAAAAAEAAAGAPAAAAEAAAAAAAAEAVGLPVGAAGAAPHPHPTTQPTQPTQPAQPSQPSQPTQPTLPSQSSLPTPASPLVGRQAELALARLHLADAHCRILTITGPGGTGKTRLALQVALEQQHLQPPHGVHFVPLDAVTDPTLIPLRIADALQLSLHGQEEALTQVAQHLGSQHLLLILDNYEHLMAAAELPRMLTQACSNLKIMVTSRERLNVEEEWVLPLSGLQAPPRQLAGRAEVEGYEAVQLFMQRAKRADLRFTLGDEDLTHLCEVCHLVGGSPLGLELAAAWVKVMPCEEIARELRGNLDLLESSSRGVSARHRSVRATFEYSWVLLSAEEQGVLGRLSVFRGGFTREAAREVAGADLRVLASLVDKSLLEVSASGRYDFHPLLHQFVEEKLAEHPEELRAAQARHGAYYHGLLQGQLPGLRGVRQAQAQRLVGEEFENIRGAWRWAVAFGVLDQLGESLTPLDLFLDDKGRHREAVELIGEAINNLNQNEPAQGELIGDLLASEAWANWRSGRDAEARSQAERSIALLRPSGHPSLPTALNTLAAIEHGLGNFARARQLWEETVAIVEERGDERILATVVSNLANAEVQTGDRELARKHYEEALATYRKLEHPSGIATTLHNLSEFARQDGDLDRAHALEEEAVRLAREHGLDVHLPLLLQGLGESLVDRERYPEAESHYLEALTLARQAGDKSMEAWLLADLGSLKTLQGDYPEARARFAEALQLARTGGYQWTALRCLTRVAQLQAKTGDAVLAATYLHHVLHQSATGQSELDVALGYLQTYAGDLSPTETEEAQQAGASMPLEEAIETALRYLRDRSRMT